MGNFWKGGWGAGLASIIAIITGTVIITEYKWTLDTRLVKIETSIAQLEQFRSSQRGPAGPMGPPGAEGPPGPPGERGTKGEAGPSADISPLRLKLTDLEKRIDAVAPTQGPQVKGSSMASPHCQILSENFEDFKLQVKAGEIICLPDGKAAAVVNAIENEHISFSTPDGGIQHCIGLDTCSINGVPDFRFEIHYPGTKCNSDSCTMTFSHSKSSASSKK